ncbi:MAG: GntR family transcriptional regulator [Chloroflexota bacterium]
MDKLESYLEKKGKISNSGGKLLRDAAYERLKDGLQNAELKPGDPLSEPRIAKALGISRTPIRAALQLLSQEGLLEVIPGRAILVATPSSKQMIEAIEIRLLIEPELIKLATPSISEADLAELVRLTACMEEAARAGERAEWSKHDTQWHALMHQACPNALLGELLSLTRNRLFKLNAVDTSSDDYLLAGTLEHKAIVDAMLERDAEKVEALTHSHLLSLMKDTKKRLGFS